MIKRGSKRSALSGSDPNLADSTTLRSKRVMDAPSFDVHRAESSRQHLRGGVPLDAKRAESARHHVRALNTQFASWVQLQLQNHPDELWEDGAKDYLSHASHILEQFKDVVDWLRAEAAKSESAITAGLPSAPNKTVAALGNSRPSLKSEVNNGSAQEIRSSSLQSSSLSNSHGSGVFSISRTSSSPSDLQNSALPTSQNSGLFSFSQKPASSNLQSSLSGSQGAVVFGTNQTWGFFGLSQTPTSSSLQSSGLPSSNSSGLFGITQKPTTSSLMSSGLSSSQSSGFSSISQKPANSSSQSSGLSNSQSPGTQNVAALKVETSGDVDEENELEKPSSPSLKKTEEKGVIVVHEVKCKVYVKPDSPADKAWKDIGVGQLSIKCKDGVNKAAKESKPTIIIRNDAGRILLNALIYPGIKMNINKNTIATIFHTSDGGQNDDEGGKSNVVARTYLFRLKTADETTKLASAIQDYAPST